MLGGRELNIYHLYEEVQKRGGSEHVSCDLFFSVSNALYMDRNYSYSEGILITSFVAAGDQGSNVGRDCAYFQLALNCDQRFLCYTEPLHQVSDYNTHRS